MGQHIIIYGDPCGAGFAIIGPFDCNDDALDYARRNVTTTWWITRLEEPVDEDLQMPT